MLDPKNGTPTKLYFQGFCFFPIPAFSLHPNRPLSFGFLVWFISIGMITHLKLFGGLN